MTAEHKIPKIKICIAFKLNFLKLNVSGDEKIVELLLATSGSSVDLNLKDNNGLSPLLTAVVLEKEKIAEVLLRKGADVNVKDKDGLSPLALALKKGNDMLSN